jgi:hypothetical protein
MLMQSKQDKDGSLEVAGIHMSESWDEVGQ